MMTARDTTTTDDLRESRFDAAAAQFAAPLARLASALEDGHSGCESLLQDIHVALWHSLADVDANIPLRTWVFRVALQAVANQQPNMQDKDLRNMPMREAWASRRRLAKLVSVDDLAFGELRSPTGLIHGLNPPDRELVWLYLEDVPEEEAADIGGWSPARVQAAYQRVAGLLVPGAREAWGRRSPDAQPVTRFLVHLRIGDLRNRRKREHGGTLFVIPFLTMGLVLLRVIAEPPRWLAAVAFAGLAVAVTADAIKTRRDFLAGAKPIVDGRLTTSGFHRRLLETRRDELLQRWNWKDWLATGSLALLLLSRPLERGIGWTWPVVIVVAALAGIVAYRISNRREARALQGRIDAARGAISS